MISTSTFRPSTTSSLFASTNTIRSCVGGRVAPRRNLPPLHELARAFPFEQFLLESANLSRGIRRKARFHLVLDIGLPHSRAHRFNPTARLRRYPLRCPPISVQLRPQGPHHPNRSPFLCSRVPPTGFPAFVHDSILVSEVWNSQQTQDGSIGLTYETSTFGFGESPSKFSPNPPKIVLRHHSEKSVRSSPLRFGGEWAFLIQILLPPPR